MKLLTATLAALALSSVSLPALAQDKLSTEVIHVFTSAGERPQVDVLKDAFAARGGEWIDGAVPAGGAGRGAVGEAINRILAGDPPEAVQIASGQDHLDLVRQGMLMPITDVAEANGWKDVMSPAILKSISVDGEVYLAPMAVHAPNWLWYNKKVLDAAGVEPPTKLDETFFAAMDKLREAGYIPYALSGTPSPLRFLFEAFVVDAIGSSDEWYAIWREKDDTAIRGDAIRTAFERLKRMKAYGDEGYSGRVWAPTLDLVVSDQAAFIVLGDWAMGTFNAAGKVMGTDYGCVLTGNTMIIHADFLGFPNQTDPKQTEAQKLLAATAMDPATQSAFSALKGSIPARSDADVSHLNACSQTASSAFNDPTRLVANSRNYLTPSSVGDITDLLVEFVDSPDMTADEAVDRLAEIVEAD